MDKRFDLINGEVSQVTGIPVDQIRSRSKRTEILFARYIAMYLIKQKTTFTLKSIGDHYGGRDHSTVISALETVEELIKANWGFTHDLCLCWDKTKGL